MKPIRFDIKNFLIALLLLLFIIKIPRENIYFVFWMLYGILLCCSFDLLIQNFFLKRKLTIKSAIITGFIVSGIIDYNQPWYILLIFSLIAIISKHLIKYKNKHIFNPANFGLFCASLFGVPLTWNIESNIYLIILAGLYIIYRLKKIAHLISFVSVFSLLSLVWFQINPLNLINWFFVFVMLIEPKTSGAGLVKGIILGSVSAGVGMILFKIFPQIDIFVCGLVFANLAIFLQSLLSQAKT